MKTTLKPTERAAMQIALKTGLLRPCTQHWVYVKTFKAGAFEHACRLANYLISHFARSVACFKGNRQKLIQMIEQCYQQAQTKCPHCAGI